MRQIIYVRDSEPSEHQATKVSILPAVLDLF